MTSDLHVSNLRFEHHPTGLGLPTSKPRLSWAVTPSGDGIPENWRQTSYEVEVRLPHQSESQTYGVESSTTVLVPWPAEPLNSCVSVAVRVRSLGSSTLQDAHNTPWSEWATIEAALLNQAEWTAQYITGTPRDTPKHPDEDGNRPIRFRKTFNTPSIIPTADRVSRLYITALGVYEAFLNGQRIGDECLAPGWTSYEQRLQYQVFDVGPLLQAGENSLVVDVAEGWYSGWLSWNPGATKLYGKDIGLLAQLRFSNAADPTGPVFQLQTDESWESHESAIVSSSLYNGECYDLGLESADERSGDALWEPVRILEAPTTHLIASSCSPVRVTQVVEPIAISRDPDGKVLVDFGQNLVGRLRIPFLRKPDNHRLIIRHAEVLENERLGTGPLRHAKATDVIIFGSGKALEDWCPRFTYHGFRYVEITGWTPEDADSPLQLGSLVAEVIHTDFKRTGYFSCSDEKINQLHRNVVWSMRGNFVGLPTDCPQRDERLGWTGDIQVFTPTASYLYDCGGMLANWMQDLILDQKAAGGRVPVVIPDVLKYTENVIPHTPQAVWDDAVVLVPWVLYQSFQDKKVLEDSWSGLRDYLRVIPREDDGLWHQEAWQLGDWLDPSAPNSNSALGRTDGTLVADEYLVHVTSVASKIAAILGKDDEAKELEADHTRLSHAFRQKYMANSGLIVGDSQTALALALVFGLHGDNAAQRKVAGDRLDKLARYAKFKVSTGFAGTPVILEALTQGGYLEVAYRMLLEQGNPSWLYPVTMGATTIWERWDSMLEDGSINGTGMTSFNHYALGSVAAWLHKTVGGLTPLEPGWKTFLVRPRPGGPITHADATFISPYGRCRCAWEIAVAADGARTLRVHVSVPPNATAYLERPDGTRTQLGSGHHEASWGLEENTAWPPKAVEVF